MSKFRLIVAVLFALFFASSVHAEDIAVDADCSLTDAIIAANRDHAEGNCPAGRGADTIILSQDITLRAELPIITSKITIEGNGYTISGNNRYRIFYNYGGTLTIHDLTMTNGYVEGDIINAETTANPIGGAILNWQGTVTISDSVFSDNLAEYHGGTIYNRGRVSISDSIFSDNLADENGGAIYNSNGTLSISNSTFSGNSADDDGGAIHNWKGTLTVSDSTFRDNLADSQGGAIHNDIYGELSINDSAFSHNSADDGGAIYGWGELNIVNSAFSRNSASSDLFGRGGAIYNWGELNIVNSSFSHNSADDDGGAIYNKGEANHSNSSFNNNSAEEYGGAIYNGWDGELSIGSNTFSHNSAKEYGGAIYNKEDLRLRSSTFSGNSADKGGAIYNGEEGKLRMTNSIIIGNGGACISDSRLRHNISNFIQDGSCSPAFKGNPKLSELVEPEDGSPAYFPLLAGSPAIDAADDGYCPATDQIGTKRPQGTGCDIGAIEFVGSSE